VSIILELPRLDRVQPITVARRRVAAMEAVTVGQNRKPMLHGLAGDHAFRRSRYRRLFEAGSVEEVEPRRNFGRTATL
jgi:hypothetical protein